VLWTDWGKPTLSYDQTLGSLSTTTVNLRDVLASGLPPVSQGAFGCPNPPSTSSFLRAAHTGTATLLGCFGSARPGTATGYVTVDTVRVGSCGGSDDLEPWDRDYFSEEASRRATDQNVLAGDFFLVDIGENFSQGFDAVSLVADPTRFPVGPPSFSFWGRFVDFEGRDHRLPLSDSWSARFAEGGAFDGTDLLVWREIPGDDRSVLPDDCEDGPSWFPLGERSVAQRSEVGAAGPPFASPTFFSLATQRTPVESLSPSFLFGTLLLDLGHGSGNSAQAWVGWTASAAGRFSVGQTGVPTHDLCDPSGVAIGAPGGALAGDPLE
jgi:hypothetical protein